MFKNISLSILALGGIGLFVSCAASPYSVSPTKPADCLTARRDLTTLQNELAATIEKTFAGKTTAVPFSSVVAILSGPYDDRTPVAIGQYTTDIKSKMRQIQTECRI